MSTPADRVPPNLLRHLHLVVNRSIPRQPQPNLDFVVSVLRQAPELTQHRTTVTWKFLSGPPADGESMLVWQPPQMGTSFASDGYVWADVDTAYPAQEYKGVSVEMYAHRSGFLPGQEQVSTHARRRYRLRQHPSLWLICYHKADPRDHRPVRENSISPENRQILMERAQIQRNKAQLVRKEFMLHDTPNFPNVSFPGLPGGQARSGQQPMGYPGNVMAQMGQGQFNPYLLQQQRQQQAMEAQARLGPSPSKRPRHGPMPGPPVSTTAIPVPMRVQQRIPTIQSREILEEHESTGADYMDILTPRDIALERYVKHHEWLEEVLSSPYDTHQIVPPELGFGRKGELESLTMDFFVPPMVDEHPHIDDSLDMGVALPDPGPITRELAESKKPVVDEVPIVRVGRLEGSKAADFTKRANDRVAELNAEMEALKKRHAKRMAKLSQDLAFKEAQQKVRVATLELINGDAEETAPKHEKEIEDLAKNLELKEGKIVVPVAVVECTDKGGLEETQQPAKEEAQDYDMTDTFDLDGAQLQLPSEPAPVQQSGTSQASPSTNPVSAPGLQATSQPSPGPAGEVQTIQQQPETGDLAAEDYVMVSKEDGSTPQGAEPAIPAGSTDSPAPAAGGLEAADENPALLGDAPEESVEPNGLGDDLGGDLGDDLGGDLGDDLGGDLDDDLGGDLGGGLGGDLDDDLGGDLGGGLGGDLGGDLRGDLGGDLGGELGGELGDDGIDFGDMDTGDDGVSGYAQEIAKMGATGQDDLALNSPPMESPLPDAGAPTDQPGPSAP